MSCTELSTFGECNRCTIYSEQFDQLQSFFVDWSAELIRQLKAEREMSEPMRSNRLRTSQHDGWDSSRDSSSNKTANQPPGSNDCGYGGDGGSANQEASVGSDSSARSPNEQRNFSSTGFAPVLSQVWGSVARKVNVPATDESRLPCDSQSPSSSNTLRDDNAPRQPSGVLTKIRSGKALYESVDQSEGGTGMDYDEPGKGDKPECIFDILRETEAGRRTTAWTKRKDKVSSVIGKLRMTSVGSANSVTAHLDDTMDTLDSDVLNEARAAGTEVGEDEVLEFFDQPTPFGSYLSSGTGYDEDGQPADDGAVMERGRDGNTGITDDVPSNHERLGHGMGAGERDGGSLAHCSFESDQQHSSIVTCTPLLPLNTPDLQDMERPDFSPRPRYSLYWYGGKETQSPPGLEAGFVRSFGSSSLPASVGPFDNIFSPKMSFTTYSTPSSNTWQNVATSGGPNDPSSSCAFLDNEPITVSSFNINKLALNLAGGYFRSPEPSLALPFCSSSDAGTSAVSSNANKSVAEVSGNSKLDTGHQLSYLGLKIMPPTESSLSSGAPSATSAFSMFEKHEQGVDDGGRVRSMPETPPFRLSHEPATSGICKGRSVEVITKIQSEHRPPPTHPAVNESPIGFSASSSACRPTERLATGGAVDDDYSKIKVKSEFYPHPPPTLSGSSSSSRAESGFMADPQFAGPLDGSGSSYSRRMQPSNSCGEHGIQSHSSEGSASGYYSDMGGAENVYDVRAILGDRIWGDPSKLAKYDSGETWDLSDWHRVKRLLCYWMLHHCKRKHYINRQTELVPFCRAVVHTFPRQKLLLEDLVNQRRSGHVQRCLQRLKQLESEIERQNYVNRGDGSVKRAKKCAPKSVAINPVKTEPTSSTKSLLSAEKDKKLRKLSKKLAKKYANFTTLGGVKNVSVQEESVVMNNLAKDWEPISPPGNCTDQSQFVNVFGTFSNTDEHPAKRSKNDDTSIIPRSQPIVGNHCDQDLGVDQLARPQTGGAADSSSNKCNDLQLHPTDAVASVEQKLRRMRRLIPDSRNLDEITRLHLETMEYRREYVKDPENTKSILDTFERFKDLPQLISLDFEYEMRLAGQSILEDFVAEWEDVWVPGIIQFAIRRDLKVMRSADHPAFQSLRWAQTVHDIDTDKRSEAALTILPFIIPGPIKYKNPNDHLKYFFAHFKDVSREAIWSELISLYSGDPQMAASPVIVRLGGQAGGTPNRLYYLFFNGQLVNTGGNASRALQLLVQSYFVFNVNYPIQVRPFYRFLEMVMGIKNNLGSTPSLDVFMTELKSHSTMNL